MPPEPKQIAKILKQNPSAVIYYHDNGSWCIYADSNELLKDNPKELLEGYDGDSVGYLPLMVEALTILTRHEVQSV